MLPLGTRGACPPYKAHSAQYKTKAVNSTALLSQKIKDARRGPATLTFPHGPIAAWEAFFVVYSRTPTLVAQ